MKMIPTLLSNYWKLGPWCVCQMGPWPHMSYHKPTHWVYPTNVPDHIYPITNPYIECTLQMGPITNPYIECTLQMGPITNTHIECTLQMDPWPHISYHTHIECTLQITTDDDMKGFPQWQYCKHHILGYSEKQMNVNMLLLFLLCLIFVLNKKIPSPDAVVDDKVYPDNLFIIIMASYGWLL